MRQRPLLFLIVILLSACKEDKRVDVIPVNEIPADTLPAKPPKINLNIIPGQSIGNISLEQNATELSFLGTADLSDAAMGKAWETWYSTNSKLINGKSKLNVYTTYKDNDMKEKVVRQIRITSPDFKTPDGLSVNCSFAAISHSFAEVDFLGSFNKPGSTNTIELYDATASGIAFEIENTGSEKKCIAVIVHRKDVRATEEYRYFHPDLVTP